MAALLLEQLDIPDFGTRSHSRRDVTLTIFGTKDTMTFPMEVTTKVAEIRALLTQRLGIDAEQLRFICKQASGYRTLLDSDEIRTNCTVKGIQSWEKHKSTYPHPMCIVGAGHFGLRQAMSFLKEGIKDFAVFDKLDRVGGLAWVRNANPTSKLQTELGVYHLQYDLDYPAPKGLKTWPSRDELLQHFHDVSAEYGILPHVQLCTAVTAVNVIMEDQTLPFYNPNRQRLRVTTLEKGSGTWETADNPKDANFSTISYFPGGLVEPLRIEYKGEDSFQGQIGYGMFDEFDYSRVRGEVPLIVGFGAFAVENVRTCIEGGAAKVWLVCRRKNLAMPRVISWFVNQSLYPPAAAMLLDAMKLMYDLIPDDPWSYYSVIGNKERTICTVRQKARFGISDVFFLAAYYERLSVVVDRIKRLKPREVMLESGEQLPANHIVKVFGFRGDYSVDKILGIREMVGYFVNGDWCRYVCAEFPGVDAGRFGGTSFSPKGIQDTACMSWFVNYPRDLEPLMASGMLPRRRPETGSGVPGYVWDARTGATIAMVVAGGLIPGLAELGARCVEFNQTRMLEMHPLEQFVDECADEWAGYCKMFKEAGDDRPAPPYPYTHEFVRDLCQRNGEDAKRQAAQK
mmetsp:Transcript_88490/g.286558  ORF Transcript_88490/g.286558 Transcript_88490/m.286558 type:complete len:627 (+) Transcript_88490:118-1998(+)